ncbi:hypothetical protein [Streptomyces daliensis]|uniref:Uncharacterized protein n=1 Tax=Streptomyces daliensis TaxID=299421 RepID=A0A8T4IJN6_9ACTN|nr:hypothetical protein [Streptomyces daliensis]
MNSSEDPKESEPVAARSVEDADEETKEVSSRILDIIDLKGKVSEPGPGVNSCEGRDTEKFYKMIHPWSLTGAENGELRQAMTRLREKLPKEGWKIVAYGRNSSRAKSLELTADNHEKKFGVNVELWEEKESSGKKPKLVVSVISACYQTPKGEKVEPY